jgi:hypothetical protein
VPSCAGADRSPVRPAVVVETVFGGGSGTWEVVLRLSCSDLTDNAVLTTREVYT